MECSNLIIGPRIRFVGRPEVSEDAERAHTHTFSDEEDNDAGAELHLREGTNQDATEPVPAQHEEVVPEQCVEPYQALIDEAMQCFDAFEPLTEAWRTVSDAKDYKMHVQWVEEHKQAAARCEVQIARAPEEILAFVLDVNNRKHYEANFSRGEMIQKISDDSGIYHTVYNGSFGFSDRDSLYVQGVVRRGDVLYYASKSIDHEARPAGKEPVRAYLHFQVLRMEPLAAAEGKNLSRVTFLHMSDPAGSLPKWVKEQAAKGYGGWVKELKKCLESGK